jgi:putative DNA primase/helicase
MEETYTEAAMLAEVLKLVNEGNADKLANRIEELAKWKMASTGQPLGQCRKAVKDLLKDALDGLKAQDKAKAKVGAEDAWKGPLTTGLIRAEIFEAQSTGTGPVWRREIATSQKGGIVANIANVSLIIRNDTRLTKVFRLNALDQDVWITRQPPWEPGAGWHPHRVEDTDAIAATAYLQMQVNTAITKATVQDALDSVGAADSYNPVADHLAKCHANWDGKRRIGKFVTRYLGAKATTFSEKKLFALIGRMFLISAVARALRPGCKVDHVLLLLGRQGLRKSTAIRMLCPDQAWFSDSLPPRLDHKDAMQHLLGTWIIEIAEFDQFKGRSAQELKAFITKDSDKFRPPYGRREITVDRRCVFAATANPGDPLHDLTGGRRYWPVPIDKIIDTARIAADRDQLLGEAVEAFEAGEPWHIDETKHGQVVADLVARQEAATTQDPWEPIIGAWLDLHDRIEVPGYGPHAPSVPIYGPHELAGPGKSTYLCDVIKFALALPEDRQTQGVNSRIAQIMQRLGWARSETRHKTKWHRWDRKQP